MKGGASKMVAKLGITIAFLLCAFFALTTPSYGQVAGATLSGVVTDSSGSVVAGVKVSVRNTATGVVTDITANSEGFYSAPNLLQQTRRPRRFRAAQRHARPACG